MAYLPASWPDVSEYEKTYPASLTNQDGTTVRVFSSVDQSTTDLHFHWMEQYGIDGAFVQRFFSGLRSPERRQKSRTVLANALKASQKYGRAISVMYDLSGLKNNGEDCSAIIQDWKELVDELKVTSQPTNTWQCLMKWMKAPLFSSVQTPRRRASNCATTRACRPITTCG